MTQFVLGLENMNGEYLISNPKVGAKPFSTQYSSYENVEYFDAYSPPITSKYGNICMYYTFRISKSVRTDDCETTYTISLSLCTQSALWKLFKRWASCV